MRLQPGDQAPSFTLPSADGTAVSLAGFSGTRLIVYFYPKAATPGCTTEACDFRDNRPVLASAGIEVVGISPDPVEKLAAFAASHRLGFRLLSDIDHAVAAAYGAWGTKRNYGREYDGMIRSTFLIDEQGTVAAAWYNVRAAGHVGRVVASLTG